MSRNGKPMPAGWTKWPRDLGLGFSFKRGDIRAELFPRIPPGGLVQHVVEVWRSSDPANRREVVFAQNHWEAADEFEAWLSEHGARFAGRFGR